MRQRFLLIVAIFAATYSSGKLSSDIAVILIEMNVQEITKENSNPECIQREIAAGANASDFNKKRNYTELTWKPKRLEWNKADQARVRSGYFIGYTPMNFFGGTICEYIGPRKGVAIGLFSAGVITCFTTLLAQYHWAYVLVIRSLVGFCVGIIYPSSQVIISRWAPKHEKGKFFIGALGTNVGTCLTMLLQGMLTERTNWQISVYYSSAFVIMNSLVYFLLVRDYPDGHPNISEEELNYLRFHLGDHTTQQKKNMPPYKQIFTNVPFWAFISIQIGNCWGICFITTSLPQYMADVMGLQSEKAGLYSGFPHLSRALAGLCFSFLGDWVHKKNCCSVLCQRKIFVIISHVIPGLLLCCMYFNDCSMVFAVCMPLISFTLNGCANITSLLNPQELSPRYAGTLFGIGNCLGVISGVIIGELVGLFTKGKAPYDILQAWKYLFIIGGGVYSLTGLLFLIFGSTHLQSFDELPVRSNDDGDDSK